MQRLLLLLTAGILWAGPATAGPDPVDGWWRIARVGQTAVPGGPQSNIYLVLHQGEFDGRDGCSGFSGGYSISGAALHTWPGITTADFCTSVSDPDLMARAGRIQRLVAQADGFRRRGATLTLRVHGEDAIQLVRAPETDRIHQVGDSSGMTPVLIDPQWTTRPSEDQIAKAMSNPAVGVYGSIQLSCAVAATGALASCEVSYSATPQPRAVEIALGLAQAYRLSWRDTRLVRRTHATILLNLPETRIEIGH